MPEPKLCTVYIRDAAGAPYATNVPATSAHDAARQAIAFFQDDFWKGPKPTASTVLEISPLLGDTVQVRAALFLRTPVAIERLLDEVRNDQVTVGSASFDRAHNRHNR